MSSIDESAMVTTDTGQPLRVKDAFLADADKPGLIMMMMMILYLQLTVSIDCSGCGI